MGYNSIIPILPQKCRKYPIKVDHTHFTPKISKIPHKSRSYPFYPKKLENTPKSSKIPILVQNVQSLQTLPNYAIYTHFKPILLFTPEIIPWHSVNVALG